MARTIVDFRDAPLARWDMRHVGSLVSREADQADSDFSATLLAMAGHDFRQPLQLITSAHVVLAVTLDGEGQREELMRDHEASAQLVGKMGQIVDALALCYR